MMTTPVLLSLRGSVHPYAIHINVNVEVKWMPLAIMPCKVSAGCSALNDIIKRALQSAGIPSILETAGHDRGYGKRPDSMTFFSIQAQHYLMYFTFRVSSTERQCKKT